MGRPKQPDISEHLLDQCTDHALEHGLPDRLQPFVDATGTSARMLLYHFGTRDDLLRAVLRRARQRHLKYFGARFSVVPGERYTSTLARAWVSMTGPQARPFLRMFDQLTEQHDSALWPGLRARATTDWLPPLQAGLATIDRAESATLVLAVFRGLILDIDATADVDRADDAFGLLLKTLDPHAPQISRGEGTVKSPTSA